MLGMVGVDARVKIYPVVPNQVIVTWTTVTKADTVWWFVTAIFPREPFRRPWVMSKSNSPASMTNAWMKTANG